MTPLSCNLDTPPSLYVNDIDVLVPKHLELKKIAINAIKNNDPKALDYVNNFYDCSIIKKDAIELKVQYYLKFNDIDGLINFSSNELIGNENSNVCLPLDDIANYIDSDSIYTIDSLICCYFYNNYSICDRNEILNEVFEEYFISLGIERPSELICERLNVKQVYLLKNISKIDVMDYLGSFDDDNDLKIERINILNRLVQHGYLKQSDIDEECKNIVDDILIESEAAKFNNSKIYIDTRYIINKRKNDIESILLKYSSEIEDNNTTVDSLFEIESMTILKGSKNELITRLINLLLVEFMDNQEVGLDKNLSSEIRHGFFGNLMCSNLQKRKLITELDENGNYRSNLYWMEYYKMVNDSIMTNIDSTLNKFSFDLNSLIEKAEQWMKTSLNGDDSERLFVFHFTMDDFNRIKAVLDNKLTLENVTQIVFKIFNEKLVGCLASIISKLNEVFAVQVDELFSNLIDDINNNKQGTSLSDLLDEIKLANTEVKEDIRTICKWFELKKKIYIDSFQIHKAVLLAEKCFKQINNSDIDIDIKYTLEKDINGTHLYALVFSMINCFNNCLKYSCTNNNIDVIIFNGIGDNFKIRISNKISNMLCRKKLDKKLIKIQSKLEKMDDNELLKNEGGSGLYKSLHSLRMISSNYDLVPSIENDFFNVDIIYEN